MDRVALRGNRVVTRTGQPSRLMGGLRTRKLQFCWHEGHRSIRVYHLSSHLESCGRGNNSDNSDNSDNSGSNETWDIFPLPSLPPIEASFLAQKGSISFVLRVSDHFEMIKQSFAKQSFEVIALHSSSEIRIQEDRNVVSPQSSQSAHAPDPWAKDSMQQKQHAGEAPRHPVCTTHCPLVSSINATRSKGPLFLPRVKPLSEEVSPISVGHKNCHMGYHGSAAIAACEYRAELGGRKFASDRGSMGGSPPPLPRCDGQCHCSQTTK